MDSMFVMPPNSYVGAPPPVCLYLEMGPVIRQFRSNAVLSVRS